MRRRTVFGAAFAGLAPSRAPKAKSGGIPTRVLKVFGSAFLLRTFSVGERPVSSRYRIFSSHSHKISTSLCVFAQ